MKNWRREPATFLLFAMLIAAQTSFAATLESAVVHGQRIDLAWDTPGITVTDLALTRCANANCTELPITPGTTTLQDTGAQPGLSDVGSLCRRL